MTIANLETIAGNLFNAGSQIDLSTMQTSAELTAERTSDETDKELQNKLKNIVFYTGNFAAYRVEDGKAVLYFGEREANPILNNLEIACYKLINKRNYGLNSSEVLAIKKSVDSGTTIRVKLEDLGLQKKYEDECSYIEFKTDDFDSLNKAQRAFAEKVHGSGDNFTKAMSKFKKDGINKTRIYVLNENYVKENAGEEGIARACRLYDLDYTYDFLAIVNYVYDNLAVRGERKIS